MIGKILLVEDEAAIREMLRFALGRAGYGMEEAADVPEARAILGRIPIDLILLDWMLPGPSGIDYARSLRQDRHTRFIPIIMLTAKGEEEDRIRGLELADDYITKPFSTRELLARIRAVLRRAAPQASGDVIGRQGLILDPHAHKVTSHGRMVPMGPTEFRLLHF
ncbi:MAG: response regulator, partial [Gammaproteobacteria bacterium]